MWKWRTAGSSPRERAANMQVSGGLGVQHLTLLTDKYEHALLHGRNIA